MNRCARRSIPRNWKSFGCEGQGLASNEIRPGGFRERGRQHLQQLLGETENQPQTAKGDLLSRLRWLTPRASRCQDAARLEFVIAATPRVVCGFYFAIGTAYAQFNRGIFAGAPCVWIPACRYTSQMVGVCCRSTIRTEPSLDFARRCVSSRAPLKNVKGADTVNCDWPPCCSTHCSRVPRKHCQFLRSRYTITASFPSHGAFPASARLKCGDSNSTLARQGCLAH